MAFTLAAAFKNATDILNRRPPTGFDRDAIVREWVAALRSGHYSQCAGSLRRGNSFCTLGVLCDVLAKHYPERFSWEAQQSQGAFGFVDKALGPSRCGLSGPTAYAIFAGGDLGHRIVHMNDDALMRFSRVADVIEAELLRGEAPAERWTKRDAYGSFGFAMITLPALPPKAEDPVVTKPVHFSDLAKPAPQAVTLSGLQKVMGLFNGAQQPPGASVQAEKEEPCHA